MAIYKILVTRKWKEPRMNLKFQTGVSYNNRNKSYFELGKEKIEFNMGY